MTLNKIQNPHHLWLNIGSGQRPFDPPWINIDSQPKWDPDVVCDGANVELDEGTADMIVLHHVLEHFGCDESTGLLMECHRLLAPTGSLLVFVPDIRALSRAFIEGKIPEQIFVTSLYGAYMGDEADRHKWGFTRQSLVQTLKERGFRKIQEFDWRPIPGANLARDWWILAIEAVK